jgi:hypothetical protein
MVVGRILEPDSEQNSNLVNTRWWKIKTLPSMLDLNGVDEDDLYAAMDWLLKRQETIEKKLAKRHLDAGLLCGVEHARGLAPAGFRRRMKCIVSLKSAAIAYLYPEIKGFFVYLKEIRRNAGFKNLYN